MRSDDALAESALEDWRDYQSIGASVSRPGRTAALTAFLLAAGYVVAAVLVSLTEPLDSGARIAEFVALVGLYVMAYRVEFHASAGSMVPTQPVLVALIVLGPVELVPLGVLAGVLLGSIGAEPHDGSWYGWSVRVLPAWHSLGPVAVLLASGVPQPGPQHWPWLVLALAAQFAIDAVTAMLRMGSAGVRLRVLAAPLLWTFRVDALMAILGAAIVFSSAGAPRWVVVCLVAVPVVLVRMLGRDRAEHVEQSRSLGAAYQTASVEAACDAMTGLGNRRRWELALRDAASRIGQDPRLQVTVVAADLDGLKYANDTFGHEAGDGLITAFAEVLVEAAPGAELARLGGDEFAVLMVGDQTADGAALVERIRAAVERRGTVHGASLSASLGWASCPPCASVADAARAADEAAGDDKRRRRAGRRTDPPPRPFEA